MLKVLGNFRKLSSQASFNLCAHGSLGLSLSNIQHTEKRWIPQAYAMPLFKARSALEALFKASRHTCVGCSRLRFWYVYISLRPSFGLIGRLPLFLHSDMKSDNPKVSCPLDLAMTTLLKSFPRQYLNHFLLANLNSRVSIPWLV